MSLLQDSKELHECYQEISRVRKANIFVFNSDVDPGPVDALIQEIENDSPLRENVIICLITRGGYPRCAFKLGRYLQDKFNNVTMFIFGACKSAGTLLTLIADELVMSDSGELGPLDIQFQKDKESEDIDSVMNTLQSLEMLAEQAPKVFITCLTKVRELAKSSEIPMSLRTAETISQNITVKLLEPITRQIDPFKFTSTYRLAKISEEYAGRLNRRVSPQIIRHLMIGYPSHDFSIDYGEAKYMLETFNREELSLPGISVSKTNDVETRLERILSQYGLTRIAENSKVFCLQRLVDELSQSDVEQRGGADGIDNNDEESESQGD